MIGRLAVLALLAAGCAAAVPAVHGGFPHEGVSSSGSNASGAPGHHDVKRRLDAALDEFGVSPRTRAGVEEVFRAHHEKALDLMRRLGAGEVDHDRAMEEHDAIRASAKSALAPLLTEEEIRRLEAALHTK